LLGITALRGRLRRPREAAIAAYMYALATVPPILGGRDFPPRPDGQRPRRDCLGAFAASPCDDAPLVAVRRPVAGTGEREE